MSSVEQIILTWDADANWRPICIEDEPVETLLLPGIPHSIQARRATNRTWGGTLSELRKRVYEHARLNPAVRFVSVTLAHRLETPKEVFVFDLDSTLVRSEGIDELARQRGNYDQMASETEKAMAEGAPFKESLRRRLTLLRGLTRDQVDYVGRQIHFNEGAEALLTSLVKARKYTAITSGGFLELTRTIQERFPAVRIFANRLDFAADDTLTGLVSGPIIGPTEKAECLKRLCREANQLTENSVAFGDGANDLLLFASAGFAIGYRSKKILDGATDLLILSGPLSANLVQL